MSYPTPETIARVAELRQKSRDGLMTIDDTREAIRFLRAERQAMPATTTKSKAKAAPISADTLFSELDGL